MKLKKTCKTCYHYKTCKPSIEKVCGDWFKIRKRIKWRLKKITAYIQQTDEPSDEIIMIIPSGYEGIWILALEDAGYNLSINYPDSKRNQEIIEAIKEVGMDE